MNRACDRQRCGMDNLDLTCTEVVVVGGLPPCTQTKYHFDGVRRGALGGPARQTQATEVAMGKQQSEVQARQAGNVACGTVREKGGRETEAKGRIREDQDKY